MALFCAMRTRTADECVRVILTKLVYRFGVPSLLVSDEAREFLSRLVQGLCSALGIQRVTTKAYHPEGNSVTERTMAFLGEALRRLEPERRGRWPEILPELEFAHATVETSATGLTPFEINHGSPAKTILSAIPLEKQADGPAVPGQEATQGLYGRIQQAAELYKGIALEQQQKAAATTMATLNDGKRRRRYKVGQRVSIYLPARGLTDGWKPKHCRQFVGPMVVTEKNGTCYTVKEEKTGKFYERTVGNVAPYTPTVDVDEASGSSSEEQESFVEGNLLAVMDEKDNTTFSVAKVLRLGEELATCHFYGTLNPSSSAAVFKPVYVERGTGLSILTNQLSQRDAKKTDPWTGEVTPDEVLDYDVRLTRAGKLSAKSRRWLENYSPAVMPR